MSALRATRTVRQYEHAIRVKIGGEAVFFPAGSDHGRVAFSERSLHSLGGENRDKRFRCRFRLLGQTAR